VIVEGSATGNELPMTPDYTVDLGLDYAMAVSGGSLLASTHYYYSDGWSAEPDNRLKQGGLVC
jgi:iron complex outermembrane recepter protein